MKKRPLHPYTQALLSQMPLSDPEAEKRRQPIPLPGVMPSPANPPAGCRFHPRCGYATDICRTEPPDYRNLSRRPEPHRVACHHAEQFL